MRLELVGWNVDFTSLLIDPVDEGRYSYGNVKAEIHARMLGNFHIPNLLEINCHFHSTNTLYMDHSSLIDSILFWNLTLSSSKKYEVHRHHRCSNERSWHRDDLSTWTQNSLETYFTLRKK